MNKLTSKQLYEKAGIPTPAYMVAERHIGISADEVDAGVGFPVVVKPAECGSSIGLAIVKDKADFAAAVEDAFKYDRTLVLEAFVDGTELTGGVIGNDTVEALPLIEIIPGEGYEFFDYDAKYLPGATTEICPARVDADITARGQELAMAAHKALLCRGYSRTDMILKDGELSVLETNTIPGMTATSLYPQAAAEAGMPFGKLLDRLIELGIENKRSTHRETPSQ